MALLGDDVTPLPSCISQAPEAYSVLPAVALSTASKAFCEWVISAVNLIMTTVGLLLLCSCGNIARHALFGRTLLLDLQIEKLCLLRMN